MIFRVLSDPNFFLLLLSFDRDLARLAREGRCPSCGAVLHQGNYRRKTRGGPDGLPREMNLRFSFCCSLCRKRMTPVSVRFFDRRVYFGAVFVLVSAMLGGLTTVRRRKLHALFGVDSRTLVRWRRWWHQVFPATSTGRELLALLAVHAADRYPAPHCLLKHSRDLSLSARLIRLLFSLLPMTSRVPPPLSTLSHGFPRRTCTVGGLPE